MDNEMKLKVEYIPIDDLKPYENNAKIHTKEQIEQIKQSIKDYNMNDPIGIWKDNLIIEGHGRLIACKELGFKEVPVIRLDHLSDEQRRAYTLIHNQTTMNTGFDLDILQSELDNIEENLDIYQFTNLDDLDYESDEDFDDTYTTKVEIPQYEITGEEPKIEDMLDTTKTDILIEKIKNSSVTKEQKDFLIKSAQRHLQFNYKNIAEYYAHQNKEMQELMEESALVIIDIDNAIANGYAELSNEIEELIENEE